MVKRLLISLAVVPAGFSSVVQAADLAPLYGQAEETDLAPEPQFTFGTGWYLRGDLGASDDSRVNALGGLTGKTDTRRDWNYTFGGGAGYKFNDYFRADLTGDYLGPQKTVETFYGLGTVASAKSNLRRFDGLVNAYIDLGTWAGFTPYIGAGVGFAGIRLDGSRSYSNVFTGASGFYKIPGKTNYDLAWAGMAGVSYSLSQNLLIDIGYRYLDLGTYQIPRYAWSPFVEGHRTELTSHQIRAGVRYMLY